MANDPWISIVVPSFNQAQFIELTLQSLLSQDVEGLEIIVVDGGSTDGSVEVIRRYADQLAAWSSEPDRGQSHALNKGFAQARGEWLGWLNSDDLLLPNALSNLRRHVTLAPDQEWWIGGGWFIDEKGLRIRKYGAPIGLERSAQLSDWREHWFAQPSTFFKRSLFVHVGGSLCEELHYAMDLDLWLRFIAHAPPGLIEKDLSRYRLHQSAKTTVLTPACEIEIVRLIAHRLGIEAALTRVSGIAQDRMDLEKKYQRLARVAAPFMRIYSPLKRLLNSGQ